MIKFNKVSYSYSDGVPVLDNINLTISKGERVAIVGSNGSGKSTLALLINGILNPTMGCITIDDFDTSNPDDKNKLKRKVGLVFQNPDNQLVSSTVEREIAFSLENANIEYNQMRERVEKVLDFFGLTSFRERLTSELSGGEKQLVALASVMVAEPEILILDEPGSYLDESGKKLLNKAIDSLLKINPDLTIIRITQYSHIAENYARVIVLRDGMIAANGPPDNLFQQFAGNNTLGIAIPLKYRIGTIDKANDINDKKTGEDKKRLQDTISIILTSISFGYGYKKQQMLFENLNLEISSDKIYGLVGPSGSGKTTLLQLMVGLLKPTTGEIIIQNFNMKKNRLTMSFQLPEQQFFKDTVDEEIEFGAKNLKLDNIESIVNECYSLVGLEREDYSKRNPFTLSGGEKRRLAFAAILSVQPSFVFFDEPTCALDYYGIEQFKRVILMLKAKGIGVIIVSHYGDIMFELVDEIISIKDGQIESLTDKKDFFSNQNYSDYLSIPEAVAYQIKNFGKVHHFSELDLIKSLK